MSYERIGLEPDAEANKLGSYYLADDRHEEPHGEGFENPRPTIDEQPRPVRRTGRHTVEIGGRDVARMEANNDALTNPMDPEARRRSAVRGRAMLDSIKSPSDRAMEAYEAEMAEIAARQPDNRDTLEREALLALNVRMTRIKEAQSSTSNPSQQLVG